MSFRRRRVGLACTFCRQRKRRCDARRPSCSNCRESDADCRYDDLPSQRIEGSGSREILNRLQDIESILERQNQNVAALSAEIQSRPSRAEIAGGMAASSPMSHSSLPRAVMTTPMTAHSSEMELFPRQWYQNMTGVQAEAEAAELPPLTIPVQHNTSSSYLLCLPEMKALIGEYPIDLFFILESRNQLPPEFTFNGWLTPLSEVHIDKEVTDYLVSAFFSGPYLCHPILDRDTFQEIYSRFLDVGMDSSVESALCLVVFALGSATLSPQDSHNPAMPAGVEYMQAAMPTLLSLSSWSISWNILLPQALVLASVYFAYIVRPLQSWRLIYSASTVLKFKLSRLNTQEYESGSGSVESILRLFWSCFLIECDRLAELELPQSELQQLTDETSLPGCSNLNPMESTCYLAEISIRRLLNRIHNSLYPRKRTILTLSSTSLTTSDEFSAKEISSATAICDELHRQLDIWYESIPDPFRPALGTEPTANERESVLRIRYYATKHIIYRPFAMYVIRHGTIPMTNPVLEKARLCLESCQLYLRNATKHLENPSQYTWTFSLSSLGAIVVLTLSSLCPSLKHLVPDIGELQTLVIESIKPWASPDSSLDAVISIIQDMQRKQRILACV